MRWVGHVAHMEEDRKVYKVLARKPEAYMGGWDQNGS
jgi:hypothetical protein